MLESGIVVLFLVPGLIAYCAIYGVFHSGKAIAPTPPTANSIEAVTVILLASVAAHGVTALLLVANDALCGALRCPIPLPGGADVFATIGNALGPRGLSAGAVAAGLAVIGAQSVAVFVAVRGWLRFLARKDALPPWIYGWSTEIANSLDNPDRAIIAYVMTTTDVATGAGSGTVVYVGMLLDMALRTDGAVTRITLWDGERYLVDLAAREEALPTPLARFPMMIIDAANIRNIAFEVLLLADPALPPAIAA